MIGLFRRSGSVFKGSSALLHSYQQAMFWRRLLLAAFFTLFVATLLSTLPWLPYGLAEDEYSGRITFVMILMLLAALTAFGAVYLRDMSRRVEQTLLTWSTVNDGLTELRRREYFFDRIILECMQAAVDHTPFSVVAMRLNALSRAAGADQGILRTAIETIEPFVKEYDCVASLGPHEVGVLLGGVDGAQAEAITARLANTVRAAFPQYAPDDFEVLAGYASYDRDGDEAGALVGIARSRLLRKQAANPSAA